MADAQAFLAPDLVERSVWVVVDPRDLVTGSRVTARLRVRLKDVTAAPIVGRSGVYCFADLDLPAATYTVRVQPTVADRYFDAEGDFQLETIPVAGQPLKRNLVSIELLPRPAYPFAAGATLARGRLVAAADGTGLSGVPVRLLLEGSDEGVRGRTDERGEFVVFFPAGAPEDTAAAGLKELKFELRFEPEGEPAFQVPEDTVREGSTTSLKEIEFPGT